MVRRKARKNNLSRLPLCVRCENVRSILLETRTLSTLDVRRHRCVRRCQKARWWRPPCYYTPVANEATLLLIPYLRELKYAQAWCRWYAEWTAKPKEVEESIGQHVKVPGSPSRFPLAKQPSPSGLRLQQQKFTLQQQTIPRTPMFLIFRT